MSAQQVRQRCSPRAGQRCRLSLRGFTLIELLITLAALAIVAAVALPSGRLDNRVQLSAAATMLASDLEYAQSLTLSAPGDPAILRVAANSSGYWVARKSAPTTPIARPDTGEPYQVVFGAGAARRLEGVTIAKLAPAGDVEYDAFGRLAGGVDALFQLKAGAATMVVSVSASTGAVTVGG
ncbi:MAG: prepilin-type N-terminal cleavage/methylation domain-containing protein [Planctomycetota bacterium]|nr:MAG: prepilin-type N-terminal cleavage/methylation domain-containing protein [Planctomycetota bacterium]